MFKKGDVVKFSRTVYGFKTRNNNGTNTGNVSRVLGIRNLDNPQKGIVLGYSFIRTGKVKKHSGSMLGAYEDDYNPGYLYDIKDNKVWLIEPLTNNNRYLKPIRALESDIELI